ncbi:hypothetical protein CD039_09650 [Staphylococcus argensis]|uniref:DUF4064 domain-containing protein n=2 Tax=Staphylococcus argensis TaxID=1607738 RepID=A0A2K4FAG3_9STAP|nr:hypothetical protein CD039_09650 [Staphylococcus argensis]
MMNRTPVRTLAWIGNGLKILALILLILVWIFMNVGSMFSVNFMDEEDALALLGFNIVLAIGFIFFIISLIISILATVWIGKKDKPAGIMLIVVGGLSIISSTIITGALWLIAGILLLVIVNDEKNDLYNEQTQPSYADAQESHTEHGNSTINEDHTSPNNQDKDESKSASTLSHKKNEKDDQPYKF